MKENLFTDQKNKRYYYWIDFLRWVAALGVVFTHYQTLFHETCCKDGMSGAPWLDTYANVCVELMEKHNFAPQDIARVTAKNPGEFVNRYLLNQFPDKDFGLGFGKIEKGYIGSLTILNTNKPQTVQKQNLKYVRTQRDLNPVLPCKAVGALHLRYY